MRGDRGGREAGEEEEGAKKINVRRRALQPEIKGEPRASPAVSWPGTPPVDFARAGGAARTSSLSLF